MTDELTNRNQKKILVADDEQDLREALFTVLTAEGYEVITAENGKIALEVALKEHPDLILLDLLMPVMEGYDVLEALRKDAWGRNVKVIVLTSLGNMDALSKTMERGTFDDYMVKSDWKLEDIVDKVNERLNH